LLAQYGQLEKNDTSEDWVVVDMFQGNLKEGLKKLASEKAVGDSLVSDKVEHSLTFQFVKSKSTSDW
jgi:hypothetical protein